MPQSSGPVAPSPGSAAELRPLMGGSFRLDAGFWGSRQELVAQRALPHAVAALDRTGRLANLTPAAIAGQVPYSGDTYADSDVYKTLEALIWEHDRQPSSDFAATVSRVAADLASIQADDGYLHSWFQRPDSPEPYSDMQMGHELYCAAHLIQAALAEQRTGASFGLMPIAVRVADHIVDRYSDPERQPLCGHPLIEMALVELYRSTATRAYLDLAVRMVDLRGHRLLGPGLFGGHYYQDEEPVRSASGLVGHCVRALYLAGGTTDVALETGDGTLLAALVRQWDDMVATKTYLTGGVGCRRKDESFGAAYELPPDHAFAETCAGVGVFMWAWRMLLATGYSRYADMMERLLFNLLPAGLSQGGTEFSYINTLHRRRGSPEFGDKRTKRQEWFRCPCCPPNLMRVVASLGCYLATQDNHGVQLHQYVQGRVDVELPDGIVGLDVRTAFPDSGEVVLAVVETPDAEWTLSLRRPDWCESHSVTVGHTAWSGAPDDAGYLRIRRRWRVGDVVSLQLSMRPRVTRPDPRLDAVRGCAAVERGPVVFCLEQVDLGDAPLESVTVDPTWPLDDTTDLGAVHAVGESWSGRPDGWPYRPRSDDVQGVPGTLRLTLKPYYSWGNRDDGPMRVWLPESLSQPREAVLEGYARPR